MSSLGQALAQAGEWERTQAVWRDAQAAIGQIEHVDTHGEALLQLIDALNKANKYERGLAVVQHSWLQATTRFEALALLRIVNPFITLKPKLDVALFEALPWVDNFLMG